MNTNEITYLKGLNRISLCTLPTPLVEARKLSERLGGPRILIKRDDLTGLAIGGNKSRALEFFMAKAKTDGHDMVIAIGPQQSNWLCCLTAAAKKCGMDVILLLLKGDNKVQGNLLLFQLLGAETRLTDIDILNMSIIDKQMDSLVEQMRSKGRNPIKFAYGPVPLLGIAGYLLLTFEIKQQLEQKKISVQHLFLGSGSGCTQAGLIMGKQLYGTRYKIHGVMLDERFSKAQYEQIISNEIKGAAKVLKIDRAFDAKDINCIDGYIEHYGTTEKGLKAIKLLAETEGIFLDPTYTSKVMAAMVDQIRDGKIARQDMVIFYHSGGIPAIFSHSDELATHQSFP
jgi:L-cysteate sulfo-lyase